MSVSFDVPIMYKLLRNFGDDVAPPTNGWGKEPKVGQKTIGDDIERIRKFRNLRAHGKLDEDMDDEDFKLHWEELTQVIFLWLECIGNNYDRNDIFYVGQVSC
jgi:hypothetical protein